MGQLLTANLGKETLSLLDPPQDPYTVVRGPSFMGGVSSAVVLLWLVLPLTTSWENGDMFLERARTVHGLG